VQSNAVARSRNDCEAAVQVGDGDIEILSRHERSIRALANAHEGECIQGGLLPGCGPTLDAYVRRDCDAKRAVQGQARLCSAAGCGGQGYDGARKGECRPKVAGSRSAEGCAARGLVLRMNNGEAVVGSSPQQRPCVARWLSRLRAGRRSASSPGLGEGFSWQARRRLGSPVTCELQLVVGITSHVRWSREGKQSGARDCEEAL
jgi:hypothetical protein